MKRISVGLSFALTIGTLVACSDDHGSTTATTRLGVVAGAADSHCGGKSVKVDPSTCTAAPETTDADAGATTATNDYGATLFQTEGDDDDCKYHLKWSSPQVPANATAPAAVKLSLAPLHGDEGASTSTEAGNATFEVVLTNKADGSPVTGAPIDIEAFLDEMHPAPNTHQESKETAPGTGKYTVGPVAFDASGRWTVRFHIHDECNDGEESPHGHVAFFVQVDHP